MVGFHITRVLVYLMLVYFMGMGPRPRLNSLNLPLQELLQQSIYPSSHASGPMHIQINYRHCKSIICYSEAGSAIFTLSPSVDFRLLIRQG